MVYRLDITARLHRRMLEIVGTGLPLIARSKSDADLVGLAHLREEMVTTIDSYCRHVHQVREAAELRGSAASDRAEALVAACTDLQTAYGTFRRRWDHRDGVAHWHEYRLSAVVMMKQVRSLVEHAEAIRQASQREAA